MANPFTLISSKSMFLLQKYTLRGRQILWRNRRSNENQQKSRSQYNYGRFQRESRKRPQLDTVGSYGLGRRNDRGEKLVEWANINSVILGNTWLSQHPRRLWNWQSPGDRTRIQIDYTLIGKHYRNALLSTKARPGADIESDHVPLVFLIKTSRYGN